MTQIAFFSVAPYERAAIAAALPGTDKQLFEGPPAPEALARVPEAEVLSVFVYDRIDEAVLARLPRLRLVSTRSTGYDHIDLAACARRGVAVANVPAYGENTVAEHAFCLIFALARRLKVALRQTQALDFSLAGLEGIDLQGKTLGVIGAGRIGLHALRIGRGLGMRTIAFDLRRMPEIAAREGFAYVPLEELLATSDVVSIHAALTPETRHLIGKAELARLKPGALLVNTARGPIIDTSALCEALAAGRLGGAGLDVLEREELIKEEAALAPERRTSAGREALEWCQALLAHDNVILTPHCAFFTREGVDRLVETSLENIRDFLAGRPRHLVTAA